jgi:hypothetical protein
MMFRFLVETVERLSQDLKCLDSGLAQVSGYPGVSSISGLRIYSP